MLSQFQKFKKNLAQEKIIITNKRLNKLYQSYSFYYIPQVEDLEQDPKLKENIQASNLIILDYYEQDPHFIVGFQNTILITPISNFYLVYPLILENKEICFLNINTRKIIEEIQLKYTEHSNNEYFQTELSNFNSNFNLNLRKIESKSEKSDISNIFKATRSCISGNLIQTGYLKLKKDRISNFYSNNQHTIEKNNRKR